ncbi:MAG: hypothetical protein NC541_02690 [bacterium]|nr:hypothetical protein [bacterium]
MNWQENIVPSWGQNAKNVFIHENTGIRILFVGNSITKHAPKESIGWFSDCGMAASCPERDYVHLLMEKVRKYDENAAYAIAQVADFERSFQETDVEEAYRAAADFRAELALFFFGANVNKDYDRLSDEERAGLPVTFGGAFEKLRNFLSNGGAAKVYIAEGFYSRPLLDREKRAVCEKYRDTYIPLGDIREKEETHGKFNHPGDEGMRQIAERFWEAMEGEVRLRTAR